MNFKYLLNAEWFGYLVLIFLALSIIKNGYQLLTFLAIEMGILDR